MQKLAPIPDPALGEDIAWRIEFMERHLGLMSAPRDVPRFKAAAYVPRPGDDHDHCAGCWCKFMVAGDEDTIRDGYCGTWPERGTTVWLCADCRRILQDVLDGRIRPWSNDSVTDAGHSATDGAL